MNVGYKIKKLRDEKSMSQHQLAEKLGIYQSKLHRIESGFSRGIDFLLTCEISKIFEKSFEYFIDDNNVVDNINENKGQMQVSCEHCTINNDYKTIIDELKSAYDKMLSIKDEQMSC
ncbi:MAG: helix-turn-helix domain-containing protein [Prevotellaceae bacterium]|jgi:transcriptional regulator with XRE-family HTH domain|nr:helix-turn-helix domain-containing protein [Prevotellaceae bacterium]